MRRTERFFIVLFLFLSSPLSLKVCPAATRNVTSLAERAAFRQISGPDRPSLKLVICQDKPIPLVRSSLRINSPFPSSLHSFVPTVVPTLERKIAAAYINIIKSELFLMRLCESAWRFLWTRPLTGSSCQKFLALVSEIRTDAVIR